MKYEERRADTKLNVLSRFWTTRRIVSMMTMTFINLRNAPRFKSDDDDDDDDDEHLIRRMGISFSSSPQNKTNAIRDQPSKSEAQKRNGSANGHISHDGTTRHGERQLRYELTRLQWKHARNVEKLEYAASFLR